MIDSRVLEIMREINFPGKIVGDTLVYPGDMVPVVGERDIYLYLNAWANGVSFATKKAVEIAKGEET